MWKFEIDYSRFKTFMKSGKNLYPSLSMPIFLLWLELQLFPLHLTFTLISTYPCELPSQSHDFSDSTLKNPLDQQSIRLTFSSILYTSAILTPPEHKKSKFGLHSPVLQPCPVQHKQHHRLLSWWALQDKGLPKHLKITVHYGEKGKSPSAFMETLSATPASCSLH